MQKFKRKSLYLALAVAVGSVGISSTASAVNINGNGLGQVLIYPYYSTRAGFDTYLSVVNTTNSAKAVKVRFTEGKNSREVLDFNLYLSPRDMWTAAVVNTATGAKLITADKSCTAPAIPAGGKEFVNFAYSGAIKEGIVSTNNSDGETTSMDRTREGYFEIIEMGTITNHVIATAVTHVGGVPQNCAVVQASTMNMGAGSGLFVPAIGLPNAESARVGPPTGGLGGTASLINSADGTDYGYDPVALDFFTSRNIWDVPGSISPDLRSADPFSIVFKDGSAIISDWLNGATAVSALLMHNNIINEFVLDKVTESGTDWVVTMPTKRYFVAVDNPGNLINWVSAAPFTKTFWLGGACEPVTLSYWNREEANVNFVDFSPLPSGGSSLCWETNVVTFNNSNLLGSVNQVNVPVDYENGWLDMHFADSGHKLVSSNFDSSQDTYLGLPTVGFMLQDFNNKGAAAGKLATYGGNFNHKYTTNINGSSN